MLPRVIASLLCLLGAVAAGLGVASATVWRPSDTLSASASSDTYLVTDPGVLDLAADRVTVVAHASGPVVVALGRTADVEAWVGTDPATRVTGLASRTELATEAVSGTDGTASPTGQRLRPGRLSDRARRRRGTASPSETASPSGTASPTGTASPSGTASPTGTASPVTARRTPPRRTPRPPRPRTRPARTCGSTRSPATAPLCSPGSARTADGACWSQPGTGGPSTSPSPGPRWSPRRGCDPG